MKKVNLSLIILIFSFIVPFSASAAEEQVTLSVDKMTCVSCPYIVKKSLQKVSGVKTVSVSLESMQAVITYDNEMTNVEQLIAATTENGFPSTVSE